MSNKFLEVFSQSTNQYHNYGNHIETAATGTIMYVKLGFEVQTTLVRTEELAFYPDADVT